MPGGPQRVPYVLEDDHALFIPPRLFTQLPVTNITYSDQELNAAAALDAAAQAACTIGAASAIFETDIRNELQRLTAGLGVINLKDVVFFYAVLAQALTAPPTHALSSVAFAAIGAAAAAPVVAAAGGVQTLSPATWPTAVSAAGQQYSAQAIFGTPFVMTTDNQKVNSRLVVPLAIGGSFMLLGALLHFNYQMSRV